MTLDGHLLLSHPAESWPACAPPVCVCVCVCVCLPSCLAARVRLLYSCVCGVFIYAYVHMHNTVGPVGVCDRNKEAAIVVLCCVVLCCVVLSMCTWAHLHMYNMSSCARVRL